jgi:hypothetical protein
MAIDFSIDYLAAKPPLEVSIASTTTQIVEIQRGPVGPAGANGSDASVTSTNINNALGYTPVSPSRTIAFSIAL